jgi:adenine deaminase
MLVLVEFNHYTGRHPRLCIAGVQIMKYSYKITNERVIYLASGMDSVKDIYIHNSRTVDIPAGQNSKMEEIIDAADCMVVLGLIDFHTHLNRENLDLGIHPDLMTLPNGIEQFNFKNILSIFLCGAQRQFYEQYHC